MDIFIQWLNTPLILTVFLIVLGVFTSIGIWIGKVNSDRASFKDFMKEIRKDIKTILGRLPPGPVTGSSPLQLTDLGESISQTLEARNWQNELPGNCRNEFKECNHTRSRTSVLRT